MSPGSHGSFGSGQGCQVGFMTICPTRMGWQSRLKASTQSRSATSSVAMRRGAGASSAGMFVSPSCNRASDVSGSVWESVGER